MFTDSVHLQSLTREQKSRQNLRIHFGFYEFTLTSMMVVFFVFCFFLLKQNLSAVLVKIPKSYMRICCFFLFTARVLLVTVPKKKKVILSDKEVN